MTDVSIIITTYRNPSKLERCLTSIVECTKFVDYKIHVLANDPNDEVRQALRNSMYVGDTLYTDRIEVLYNDDNSGSFSSNNNMAARESNGRYLLFLNDDTMALPTNTNWLYSMTKVLDNPRVGAVGSLLLYPDQQTIQHCGVFFSRRTNNLPYHLHYRRPISEVQEYVSKYRYYQAVTGACVLVRREDFDAIGGFNTNYHYMYEDIQLCLDLRSKLKKYCVYCPDAKLIHDEGISKDGRTNTRFQDNIATFKRQCAGQYFDDRYFYLNVPNHMVYRQ